MRELSPAGRRRVLARAAEIRAEIAVRDLKRARKGARVRIARKLKITPAGVTRLEQRDDVLVRALQEALKAIGGKLSLVAEFPNCPPILLLSFSDNEPALRQRASRKARSRP